MWIMSCEINFGSGKSKVTLQVDQVAKAVKLAEGITDFNVALVTSYAGVKDDLPIGAWEKYLRNIWETVPKTKKINEEDISDIKNDDTKDMRDILNMEGLEFETRKGEIASGLSPETVLAIESWKNHLMNRGGTLDASEVKRVLTSLRTLVKQGKRESNLEKMKNSAKSAIGKKFGAAKDFPVFSRLFDISIKHIKGVPGTTEYPKAQMQEDYRSILEALSARQKVLEISKEKMKDLRDKANKIIAAVGEVDTEQLPTKEDDPALKESLIAKIKTQKVNPNALNDRNERDRVQLLTKLTDTDLESLTNAELLVLSKGIESINESLLQPIVNKVINKIRHNRKAKTITDQLRASTKNIWAGWSKGYGKINQFLGKSTQEFQYYILRSRSVVFAGTALNDVKNTLYRTVIAPLVKADERVVSTKKGLIDRNTIVSRLLGEGLQRIENIYTTNLLALADQFDNNTNKWGPVDLINSYITNGLNSQNVSKKSIELMTKVRDKYVKDGVLDIVKLRKDVAANKGMAALLEFNRQNGTDTVDMQIAAEAVERGERKPIVKHHAPMRVLWNTTGEQDPTKSFVNTMKPSLKGKTERTQDTPDNNTTAPVIDFDLLSTSTSHAAEIVTDFYVTPALNDAWRTASEAVETLVEEGASEIAIESARAWKAFVQHQITGYVAKHSEVSTWMDQAVQKAIKVQYTTKLLRLEKIFAETIGNFAWWAIADPVSWIRGFTSPALRRKDLNIILNNIGSLQTSKLTTKGGWGGARVESSWVADSNPGKNEPNRMSNIVGGAKRVAQAMKLDKFVSGMDWIASEGLSAPDRYMTRPGFMGTFEREFQKLTGIKMTDAEYDLIATNNEQFMNEHREEMNAAMTKADEAGTRSSSTNNSLASLAKFKKDSRDKFPYAMYKTMAGYLQSYTVNETASWKYYFQQLVSDGELTNFQAARGMAAVLVRMATYRPLMTLYGILAMMASGGEDEDEDEDEKWWDLLGEFGRDLIGAFLTLGQGQHGSFVKEGYSQVIESVNREVYEQNDWEYSEYENSLTFKLVRQKDIEGRTELSKILVKTLGPVGQFTNDTQYMVDLAKNPHVNSEEIFDEFTVDLLAFLAAEAGVNPAYRDFVNSRKSRRYDEKLQRKLDKKKGKRGSRGSDSSRGKDSGRGKRE